MECPDCHANCRVTNSRYEDGKRWRRHKCQGCGARFTTYEITADEYDRLLSVKVNRGAIRAAIQMLQSIEKAVS